LWSLTNIFDGYRATLYRCGVCAPEWGRWEAGIPALGENDEDGCLGITDRWGSGSGLVPMLAGRDPV